MGRGRAWGRSSGRVGIASLLVGSASVVSVVWVVVGVGGGGSACWVAGCRMGGAAYVPWRLMGPSLGQFAGTLGACLKVTCSVVAGVGSLGLVG